MTEFVLKPVICQWRIEDGTDLAAALNNQKILDNLLDGIPFPHTITDAKEYIEKMISANEKKIIARAIVTDDKVIGSISINRRSNIYAQTAEIGYYIAEPYWGRGIVTEAVRQICRVLEKAGVQYEGTLCCNAVKNGKVVDMKMFALIKDGC